MWFSLGLNSWGYWAGQKNTNKQALHVADAQLAFIGETIQTSLLSPDSAMEVAGS